MLAAGSSTASSRLTRATSSAAARVRPLPPRGAQASAVNQPNGKRVRRVAKPPTREANMSTMTMLHGYSRKLAGCFPRPVKLKGIAACSALDLRRRSSPRRPNVGAPRRCKEKAPDGFIRRRESRLRGGRLDPESQSTLERSHSPWGSSTVFVVSGSSYVMPGGADRTVAARVSSAVDPPGCPVDRPLPSWWIITSARLHDRAPAGRAAR